MNSLHSSDSGTVSLAEMALLMLFIVLVVFLFIKPFGKAANNMQESDRDPLNQHQILHYMPTPTLPSDIWPE